MKEITSEQIEAIEEYVSDGKCNCFPNNSDIFDGILGIDEDLGVQVKVRDSKYDLYDCDIVYISWDELHEYMRTTMKENSFVVPPDMDKEAIEICQELNRLEGVETTESCCGHCKRQFMIFFRCTSFRELGILYRCVNRNYSDGKWEILVDGTDLDPCYHFWLRSKEPFKDYEEMNESLEGLIKNIHYWHEPRFDKYFN